MTGLVLIALGLLLLLCVALYRPGERTEDYGAGLDAPFVLAAKEPVERPKVKNIPPESPRATPPVTPPRRNHAAPSPHPSPSPAVAPCVALAKEPGFFKRVVHAILRFLRIEGPDEGVAPVVCSVTPSLTAIVLPCPPNSSNESCKPTGQEIQLNALAGDADGDELLYTWSVTGGRLSGEGKSVTWDLKGLANGTYTATVEVNDGNQHTASGSTVVTVSECTDCQFPRPPCPVVSVSCPDSASHSDRITFTASATGSGGGETYNWSVSAGTIESGQGTSIIQVRPPSVGGGGITATAQASGADPSCNPSGSCTTAIKPTAVKGFFSSAFRYKGLADLRSRLDEFAAQLRSSPGLFNAIVVQGTCRGEGERLADEARRYLRDRGVDLTNVTVSGGGCSSRPIVSLTMAPTRAELPGPTIDGSCPECPKTSTDSEDLATLQGKVVDPDDKAIGGATVTLTGENFSAKRETNSDGEFVFAGLPDGIYDLEISATSFGNRRVEGVEVKKGQNILIEPIRVYLHAVTTRYKERDVVYITYPKRIIEGLDNEIKFEWKREQRDSEVVTSETNVNGQVQIQDRLPENSGIRPDLPAVASQGVQYRDVSAKITLLGSGFTIASAPEKLDQSLEPKLVQWKWKVNPVKDAGASTFRFHVDIVWRADGLPEKSSSFDWEKTFVAENGPPAAITGATYGSRAFIFAGAFTFGLGFLKRKDLLDAGEAEDVSSSIFAPREVLPGDPVVVQVFVHRPDEDPTSLQTKAGGADEGTRPVVEGELLDEKIAPGTMLNFTLTMDGLKIGRAEQSKQWKGQTLRVSFNATVPSDFQPSKISGRLVIRKDVLPIGDFIFTIRVVRSAQEKSEALQVGALRRYKYAFISYAHKDRAEVLKRVQGISYMGTEYFQDFISLKPGDRWRPAIIAALDKSDVVLLFWSKAASESVEVRREIDYAVARRAGDDDAPPAIQPLIIEGPPPPAPPKELAFLQFDDPFARWIASEEAVKKAQENTPD